MTNLEKPKNWKEPVMKRVCHPNGSVTIYLLAERWDNMYGYMRMTNSWTIVRHKGDNVKKPHQSLNQLPRVAPVKNAPVITINRMEDLARDCPHCGVAPGERCLGVNIALIHTERRTRQPMPTLEKPHNAPLPVKRTEQPFKEKKSKTVSKNEIPDNSTIEKWAREVKESQSDPEPTTEPDNDKPGDTEPTNDMIEGEAEESVLQRWERMAREAEEREDS